jgi:hypothetical protein
MENKKLLYLYGIQENNICYPTNFNFTGVLISQFAVVDVKTKEIESFEKKNPLYIRWSHSFNQNDFLIKNENALNIGPLIGMYGGIINSLDENEYIPFKFFSEKPLAIQDSYFKIEIVDSNGIPYDFKNNNQEVYITIELFF